MIQNKGVTISEIQETKMTWQFLSKNAKCLNAKSSTEIGQESIP